MLPASVIKHKRANQGPYDTTDKFKVEIYHDERLIGSKVIASHLKDEDDMAEVQYLSSDIISHHLWSQPLNESLGFAKLDTASDQPLYLPNSVSSE